MGGFELQFVGQRFQPPALGTGRTAVMDSGRARVGRACVGAVGPGACVRPRPITTPRRAFFALAHPHHPLSSQTDDVAFGAARRCSSWFAVIGILSCRLPDDNLSNSIYWALRDGGSIPHGTLQHSARFAPLW